MEGIIQWLEAGPAADYQTGVRLLEQHTKNRSLINHLARKDSPANREKLTYELLKAGLDGDLAAVAEATKLLGVQAQQAAGAAEAIAQAVAGAVSLPEPEQAPEAAHVPEAVREKVEDITQLMTKVWNERCQLSNQLDAASDEQGKQLVADILKRQQEYNALAERRRQLLAGEATGQPAPGTPAPEPEATAPVVPALPAVDVVKLGDELRNVRSNLSKAKGKLAKKPDDVVLQEKVTKLTIEKEQLELQLKKATE
jgi:hypothetical protein